MPDQLEKKRRSWTDALFQRFFDLQKDSPCDHEATCEVANEELEDDEYYYSSDYTDSYRHSIHICDTYLQGAVEDRREDGIYRIGDREFGSDFQGLSYAGFKQGLEALNCPAWRNDVSPVASECSEANDPWSGSEDREFVDED